VFHIHAHPQFPAFYDRLWRDLKDEIAEIALGAT
jgi:hypothetical protein